MLPSTNTKKKEVHIKQQQKICKQRKKAKKKIMSTEIEQVSNGSSLSSQWLLFSDMQQHSIAKKS